VSIGANVPVIVCADVGAAASGVSYVMASGQALTCGTDASGAALYAVVSSEFVSGGDEAPVEGGAGLGLAIGGAVFGVLATAFCVRVLRNFINSGGDAS